MKPHRIRLAHHLVENYGLYRKMEIFRPQLVSDRQMALFHTDDYVDFLSRVTPDNQTNYIRELTRYNLDVDCPVFDGLFKYCQTYCGGSIGGAYRLNHGLSDISINWAGGLHHAKKSEASGFCYVNDIVLGILELLKYHPRVLYIDIDVHHGDGVEEAFYTTDRVMTVSFHKYGDFFPGTGALEDTGIDAGKNHSINVPLRPGIDDETFSRIFRSVMDKVMESYRPTAIVLQCGADSLTGDRIGCFNLTTKGHGSAVEHMRSFGLPMMVLGGGGYTVRNVSRCWAYETALCVGTGLPDAIPFNEYFEYYAPDYQLHLTPSNMENLNSKCDVEATLSHVFSVLKEIEHAPSVQYTTSVVGSVMDSVAEEWARKRDEDGGDMRDVEAEEGRVEDDREFYDGDMDVDGDRVKYGAAANTMR